MTNAATGDQRRALALMAGLFALFGCVTWLNGVLIPFLKVVCELDTFEALLVTFAFYVAYFVMAIPSARVLAATGYRHGMALGLTVMAAGTVVFVPAALMRSYGVFLAGLFIQGTGLCLLQTAANPYVIILGPHESAARRVSIMGVCNKLAGAISPMLLGALVFADFGHFQPAGHAPVGAAALSMLAHRLIIPYLAMAIGLLVLATGIERSKLPEPQEPPADEDRRAGVRFRWSRHPLLLFGFWALFFEMALEVIAGDTIVLYGQALHFPIQTARFFASLTLTAMVAGYLLGIVLIPKRMSQELALGLSAGIGIALTVAVAVTHGIVSILMVASLGFANAVLWPAIFPIALTGLGEHTKTGAAIMIMAIVGGAVVPPCYGLLARFVGNQMAYLVLVPMYAYIVSYALFARRRMDISRTMAGAST
ncbi:MAG TPA: sugar MFS transporter [Steroidobacteraceae bacterium]|jgi:glucose/galactose transporter|nr:sugar MFS transporter [Steroidobacteraceae bacterium]